jgi:tetratricopeptide (TPR) repeat protein
MGSHPDNHCPGRKFKTFFLPILSGLILASCGSPRTVRVEPQPVVPEIDWGARIREADELAARGHYAALRQSFGMLKDILGEPSRRDEAVPKLLKTAMALALREKDLGILGDGTLLELEDLVAREPSLASYAPFVELLGYLPARLKGTAGDGLSKGRTLEDQLSWITDRAGPIDEELRAGARSEDLLAVLRIVFRRTFFYKFPDKLDPAVYAELHAESRLVAFQNAVSPNPDEARLTALLDEDPDFHEAHYFLGELAMAGGQLLTAEKHYLSALEGIPDFPSTLISLAKIAFHMEELQPCLDFNERALALVPAYRDALLGKALCLGYLGRNGEAIEVLRRILELGSSYMGEAHYWTAWNFNEMERLEEARRSIDSARTFLVGQPDVLTLSGIIAYGQGRHADAEKDLLEALASQPSECDAAYHLGKIYADLKRWVESGLYFSGAADCYEQRERALEKKIEEIGASELGAERKERLLRKKRQQVLAVRATKATCQYNGAAGFHNGGKFELALELAERARAHPSFSEAAADLIRLIKDRS